MTYVDGIVAAEAEIAAPVLERLSPRQEEARRTGRDH